MSSTVTSTSADRGTASAPVGAGDISVQPVLVALTQFGVKIGDDCMALGSEWLDFLGRRVQSDIDLPVRLAGCGCPEAVVQAWSDFFSRAAQDYKQEIERLTDLSIRLQRDAATPPPLA